LTKTVAVYSKGGTVTGLVAANRNPQVGEHDRFQNVGHCRGEGTLDTTPGL